MSTTIATPQQPYFDIWPFVSKRINASMNEGLFTSYSYRPKHGVVFAQQLGQAATQYLELNNSRMPIWSANTTGNTVTPYKGSLSELRK